MKKILIITHIADMDGRGCEILAKLNFNNVEVILTEPSDLFTIIKDINDNKKYLNYDEIFITDLAMNLDCALIIENNNEFKEKVKHIDHHITDAYPKHFSWSNVIEKDETGFEPCATSLFYDYLKDNYNNNKILFRNSVKEVVDGIRCQDTYTFEKENNTLGPALTYVFSNNDENIFIKSIIDRLIDGPGKHFNLTKEENALVTRLQNELQDYVKECDKRLIRMNFLGYKIGLSISTKYRSTVGNKLSEKYKDELDFIVIADCNREKFSVRTVNEINLNHVCNQVGGGGHPKAAGFNMTKENLEHFKPYLDLNLIEKYKNENF